AGNFQSIQVSHSIETQYTPEFQAGQVPGYDPREYIVPGEPAGDAPLPQVGPQFAPPVSSEGTGIVPAAWNAPTSWNPQDSADNWPQQAIFPNSMISR
ncbi:MAG: hypothetical protein HYV60_03155, partial [Planctomycetia bacterium]|nr:hypothetical protein [Planctomycetia bacterium]